MCEVSSECGKPGGSEADAMPKKRKGVFMIRYIALLRGINFSGKNKISMPDLKTALGEKGF